MEVTQHLPELKERTLPAECREELHALLKEVYGYDNFRSLEIYDNLFESKDKILISQGQLIEYVVREVETVLNDDAQADNGYVSVEDAELMTDILGNGNRLAVYTVADNTAVSVNKIKDLRLIPVGLFANDDDVTTVTFTGVAALLEPTLYDAETNTETALTEGYTLTIDGESHGRYFIRTRGAGEGTTDIEETVTDGGNDVNVYSVESGKVVVASDTELLDVMIYSVGGAVLKHETVSSGCTAITLDNVDSGVVIVKVTTADCTITRKIIVR